jgi:hypothetical protein
MEDIDQGQPEVPIQAFVPKPVSALDPQVDMTDLDVPVTPTPNFMMQTIDQEAEMTDAEQQQPITPAPPSATAMVPAVYNTNTPSFSHTPPEIPAVAFTAPVPANLDYTKPSISTFLNKPSPVSTGTAAAPWVFFAPQEPASAVTPAATEFNSKDPNLFAFLSKPSPKPKGMATQAHANPSPPQPEHGFIPAIEADSEILWPPPPDFLNASNLLPTSTADIDSTDPRHFSHSSNPATASSPFTPKAPPASQTVNSTLFPIANSTSPFATPDTRGPRPQALGTSTTGNISPSVMSFISRSDAANCSFAGLR